MITHPNAKINLGLNVLRKRPDGYHDLETLFVPCTEICDSLEIVTGDDWSRTCAEMQNSGTNTAQAITPDGKVMITIARKEGVDWDPLKDLTVRAYELLAADYDLPPVKIYLQKRIPVGAGLGGGSADAAATLRALNRMAGSPLSSDKLLEIAASLGADVPFCLFGGTAICRGVGDVIESVDGSARRFYTVVMGDDRVSTAAAYRALDEQRRGDVTEFPTREDLRSLAEGGAVRLHNDFEAVVFPSHPVISDIKRRLLSLGATDALMSGSGAAVFGVFPDAGSAARAASAFSDADAFAVETVGQYYS